MSQFDQHPNLAIGTVLIAPTPATSGTTITLSTSQGEYFEANAPCTFFPPDTQPRRTNSEIGYITGVSGDQLTVLRAQEGTSARAISTGWTVMSGSTAKTFTDIEEAIDAKVDAEPGKGLSTNDYTDGEQTKLAGIAAGATQNASDAALRDRTTHTGTQAISTVTGLQTALDTKLQVGGDLGGTISAPLSKARTVTYTVAKSGTADFVCTDYPSDNACIQAAMNAANTAGGGQVVARAGRYLITSSLVPKDYVWLSGEGMRATILAGQSGLSEAIMEVTRTSGSPLSYFKMSDLQLDGTDMPSVSSTGLKGIHVEYAYRLKIENVLVYNTPATGFGPDFLVESTFTNCIAYRTGRMGGNPGFNGFGQGTGGYENESIQYTSCYAIEVGNNGFLLERQFAPEFFNKPRDYQFVNCYAIGCRRGFRDSSCAGVTMTNCVATDSTNEGFYFDTLAAASPPVDVVITASQAYNNGDDGFHFADDARMENVAITSSRASGNLGDGFRVSANRTTLTDCHAWNNRDNGVDIHPTTGSAINSVSVRGVKAWNNGQSNVNGTRDGIRVNGGTIAINSLIVSDCETYDDQGASTQYFGINILGVCSNVDVHDNKAWGHGKGGIYYTVSITSGAATDALIHSNEVWNNGRVTNSAPDGRGIYVSPSGSGATLDGLVLYGNRAYDNQGTKTQTYGVALVGGITNAQVFRNDVRGNLTAGILNSFTSQATNMLRGNKGYNADEFYDQGSVSGAVTFNLANGNIIKATVAGDITTATLSNGTSYGDTLTLELMQDGTGGRVISAWSSNVAISSTFTPASAANSRTFITFVWDGSKWADMSRTIILSGYAYLLGSSGGQTLYGGTAASNNLTLHSTSDGTKGKIVLGAGSAFDDANEYLGIGTTSPSYPGDFRKSDGSNPVTVLVQNTVGSTGAKAQIALGTRNTGGDLNVGAIVQAERTDTGSAGTNDLVLYSSSGTTMTERARIKGSGAVNLLGSLSTPLAAKTTTYTITATDSVVTGDATGGAFTITLPTAASIAGRKYTIKKIDAGANAVTVGTTSSQTIDGSTTYPLGAQYKYVSIVSDGSNWLIVGNN